MEDRSRSTPPMARLSMVPEPPEETYPSHIFSDYINIEIDTVSRKRADGTFEIVFVKEPLNNSVSNEQVAVSEKSQGNQVKDGQGSSGQLDESVDDGSEESGEPLNNSVSNEQVAVSEKSQGNQVKDEQGSSGQLDESVDDGSEESGSQNYEDELYEGATGMSLDTSSLVAFPKLEDLIYEISCTKCAFAACPPRISCAYGHLICESCYEKLEDKTECKTEVGDPDHSAVCHGKYYEIDETIENTPYFKYFLETSQYACFAEGLGCKVLSSGKDIDHHEKQQCPYRFVKYCGYRSGENQCEEIFPELASHVKHLIENHGVPVYLEAEGHFMIKYDRDEFKNTDDEEVDVIPLVRAVQGGEDKDFMIVLMAKELGDDKTRVWFLDTEAGNGVEVKKRYVASICIHPPRENNNHIDADFLEQAIEKDLAVIPKMNVLANLEENPKDEDGLDYYLDLDNEVLNRIKMERDGQKYFAIMTSISEKGANLPASSNGTRDGAEEMDVDAVEKGDEEDGKNGRVEAMNVVADEKNDDEEMEDEKEN